MSSPYLGSKKLQQVTKGSTSTATMYQATVPTASALATTFFPKYHPPHLCRHFHNLCSTPQTTIDCTSSPPLIAATTAVATPATPAGHTDPTYGKKEWVLLEIDIDDIINASEWSNLSAALEAACIGDFLVYFHFFLFPFPLAFA
ncbi:hypothetical protein L2E82_25155 [Cichorium intybus]|uniref:Uncharacterized protein n=1 Tax=Cichorium intybus TaxID=13427 RepID=A0ACB9E336_CICIN|nr:hypothetical protein L2E82_25155 [Cichorium intybus]